MPASHAPDSADALEWFLTGFSARDLAEPLLSVDESSPAGAASEVLLSNRVDVVGVRALGIVRGWIEQEDLHGGQAITNYHSFDPATLVADSSSLKDVVCLLHLQPRLFVRAFGQISGVISRAAIEKPPLRMWLFGLITISEQRVTRLIDQLFPNDAWQAQLSEGRLTKAKELQALRQSRGQRPALLDCLQFGDKGQIVARHESLRSRTRFDSRSGVERFVQALQDLRNNLAHAQDISGDWEVIHELAANVQRIVCGRDDLETSEGPP